MPSISPIPSEADIIFNRASVALAKSQRLIASWLPPPTASELAKAKTEEEIEKEEQEMFTPIPELLGLGASVSQELQAKQQKHDADEKLRLQLLGKDYQKHATKQTSKFLPNPVHPKAKPKPIAPPQKTEANSDDEEGRSSLGQSKRLDKKHSLPIIDDTDIDKAITMPQPPKRPSTYLDQVLAEKAYKRSKKSGQKKGISEKEMVHDNI